MDESSLTGDLASARIYDLSHDLAAETPVSSSHPPFRMGLVRRHGDLVREESLFPRHRITPYLGMKLRGVVGKTIRRGEVIYSDGTITARTKGRLTKPARNENAASGTHAQ